MRKRGMTKLSVLICALALAVWALSLFFAQRMADFAGPVSVSWGEGGPSPAELKQLERYALEDGRQGLPALTLWEEQPKQGLTDESGHRYALATMLFCYGQGGDLYPAGFLFGSYPTRGDTEGIALDTAAANALWGSTGAVGQAVRWNDKTYYLRGVFEGQRSIAIVQDGDDSQKNYSNLLVKTPSGGADAAKAFLASAGLDTGQMLDLPFFSWCVGALSALPGLVLAFAIIARLFRRGWRLRYSPFLLSQYLLPALLGAALTLWAAGFPWEMPAKLIPTRWSDLDFWSKFAQEIGTGLEGVLTGSMALRDFALWTPALYCLLLAPMACALVALAVGRAKVRSWNGLLTGGLGAMGAVYALALALSPLGGVEFSLAVWSLPLLWQVCDLMLALHKRSLKPKRPCRIAKEVAHETDQAALGGTGV